MTAQPVAGFPTGVQRARRLAVRALLRRPGTATAVVGATVSLLALVALLVLSGQAVRPATATTTGPAGAPWPSPLPRIRSAELWYATTPAAGVWAELKVVLDNPLPASTGATKTTLLVSGTLMEDFRIRSAEPKLLHQPRRRPDGRYALVFPAPIPESLNWFRVYLTARKPSPRPLGLSFLIDGTRALHEQAPAPVQVFYTDRQADPFKVVPEPLVSWVPGQARSAFPVLVLYAIAIGSLAAAGCAAAFWAVRR